MTTKALTAAILARQDAALDKQWRFSDVGVSTFRKRIEAGDFAYRVAHSLPDGKYEYSMILRSDLALVGGDVDRATSKVCGKLVFDFASGILPTVYSYWDDDTEIVSVEDEAEINRLFRS